MGMPSSSACVFMCVSLPVCVCVSMCICVSRVFVSACLFATFFFVFMFYGYYLKCVCGHVHSYMLHTCACMTEHGMCVWNNNWEHCYLVRCFPHYFSGKWAISHIARRLIVSLCKSIQELQLKCSLMWYNWCLPNPLFAHLPLSLNF